MDLSGISGIEQTRTARFTKATFAGGAPKGSATLSIRAFPRGATLTEIRVRTLSRSRGNTFTAGSHGLAFSFA